MLFGKKSPCRTKENPTKIAGESLPRHCLSSWHALKRNAGLVCWMDTPLSYSHQKEGFNKGLWSTPSCPLFARARCFFGEFPGVASRRDSHLVPEAFPTQVSACHKNNPYLPNPKTMCNTYLEPQKSIFLFVNHPPFVPKKDFLTDLISNCLWCFHGLLAGLLACLAADQYKHHCHHQANRNCATAKIPRFMEIQGYPPMPPPQEIRPY